MKYSSVKNMLERLEGQVQVPSSPPLFSVRSSLSPVQAFALHQRDLKSADDDLPIVVSIGANYTQGQQEVPRDRCPNPPGVEDDLSSCLRNLQFGLDAFGRNSKHWCDRGAASNSQPLPDKFHFVMTNFCIWVTEKSWQNTPSHVRANLLVENCAFGNGQPAVAGSWPHLDALADALKDVEQPVLWVGHGLHSEVFALFRLWIKKHSNNWILLPNLGYPYSHYGVNYP